MALRHRQTDRERETKGDRQMETERKTDIDQDRETQTARVITDLDQLHVALQPCVIQILLPCSFGGIPPASEQGLIGCSKFYHPPGVLVGHCDRNKMANVNAAIMHSDKRSQTCGRTKKNCCYFCKSGLMASSTPLHWHQCR